MSIMLRHLAALGLLLALVVFPSATGAQTAWFWSANPGNPYGPEPATLGISGRISSPSQAVFGTLPRAGTLGEVKVDQKIISIGELVPLPTFTDGTQASESEIFWTAQLWRATWGGAMEELDKIGDASATFSGRTLVRADVAWGRSAPTNSQVLVTVIAVRAHDNRRSNR